MKKNLKSQKLADKIAELEAAMKAAKVAEHEASERDLISLVNRANCLDSAIAFARRELGKRRAARREEPAQGGEEGVQ